MPHEHKDREARGRNSEREYGKECCGAHRPSFHGRRPREKRELAIDYHGLEVLGKDRPARAEEAPPGNTSYPSREQVGFAQTRVALVLFLGASRRFSKIRPLLRLKEDSGGGETRERE